MTGKTSLTASMGAPPRFVTREDLAGVLERQILTGELAAGTRLPSERQLAERFGVSRPVVREALRGLAERKLLQVEPGRGSFVRSAQPNDAVQELDSYLRRSAITPRQLVEARTMLECTAAELAADRAAATDIVAMRAANAGLEQGSSVIERARHDLSLHLAVVRAAHNPVIDLLFNSIARLTLEQMLRSLSDPQVTTVSLPYHHEIVDAIEERNPIHARRAMADHLSVASQLYGDDYDRSLAQVARQEVSRLLSQEGDLEAVLAAAMAAIEPA